MPPVLKNLFSIMKLHLPKSLLASIVLAFVVFPVYAETGIDGTQIPESGF